MNISAMAKKHGVSRSTIRRRLANSGRPPVTIGGDIIQQDQEVTMAAASGHEGVAAPVGFTITTAEMCGLSARLSDGHASPADLRLAEKVIMLFVNSLPPDATVTMGIGEIGTDQDDDQDDRIPD